MTFHPYHSGLHLFTSTEKRGQDRERESLQRLERRRRPMSAPSLQTVRETGVASSLRQRHANAKLTAPHATSPPLTAATTAADEEYEQRLEQGKEARALEQLDAHAEPDRARIQRGHHSIHVSSTSGTKGSAVPRRQSIWQAEIAAKVTQEVSKDKSKVKKSPGFSLVQRTMNMFGGKFGKQNLKHRSAHNETMPPTEEEGGDACAGHHLGEAQESTADSGAQDSPEHADKRDGPNHGPSGDVHFDDLPQTSAGPCSALHVRTGWPV